MRRVSASCCQANLRQALLATLPIAGRGASSDDTCVFVSDNLPKLPYPRVQIGFWCQYMHAVHSVASIPKVQAGFWCQYTHAVHSVASFPRVQAGFWCQYMHAVHLVASLSGVRVSFWYQAHTLLHLDH